jgi:NADH-quinone oxidoreductase subunit B
MQTQTEIGYNTKIEGDVIVTRVDAALNWFRKNSVWPMPMGLACCAIELMAAGASRFDISRFGSEVMRFSPRQSDCMIVAGTVMYRSYAVLQGVDNIIPVDIYISGCPPRPEAVLDALMKLQAKISQQPVLENVNAYKLLTGAAKS